MPEQSGAVIAHLEPREFYESAVGSIRSARASGERRLYVAKVHGVSEPRPEPKPMAPWVVSLKDEVESCIRDDWDVRIIERVESRDRLERLVSDTQRFDASTKYLVKASRGAEGLPFLNVLIAGQNAGFLALDDPRYRLARMGLALTGREPRQVLEAYWNDLWERSPYWIRKASGLFNGVGGIDDLRQHFERSVRNPAFVAMWFGENEAVETKLFMSDLYNGHIRRSIERAGYKAARVDLQLHNEFIMNQVLQSMRSAPFVVADFTGNRNGVYFEAGYARALDIPVIHSCRRSHFSMAHFDIRQINTLVWDEPEQFAEILYRQIVATVGQGPYNETYERAK